MQNQWEELTCLLDASSLSSSALVVNVIRSCREESTVSIKYLFLSRWKRFINYLSNNFPLVWLYKLILDKDVYKNYQLRGHLQPGRDKRPVSYLSTKSRVILSAVETSSGSVPQGRSFYTDTLQIVSQFGKWKKTTKNSCLSRHQNSGR